MTGGLGVGSLEGLVLEDMWNGCLGVWGTGDLGVLAV